MSLLDCVDRGDVDGVVAALAGLGAAERRALLPELKRRRQEMAVAWWEHAGSRSRALLVAGLGCNTAPSSAFSWANGIGSPAGIVVWQDGAVLAVVEQQTAEWQAEVLRRIAGRRPGWFGDEYPAVERLARAAGVPVPVTDGVVLAWQQHHDWPYATDEKRRGMLLRLVEAPSTPALVLGLFDVVGTGDRLGEAWRGAILGLIEAGVVERDEILDRCLVRLARGGRPGDQRGFLRLLVELAPTQQESAARIRAWLPLLDGQSTVAAHAQARLGELDAAGLLEPEHLVEASGTVFFRSEKKLLRAQLAWLDRSGRRSADFAAAAVRGAALAFGQSDAQLQERALKVAARHLEAAGPALLPELRAAAELLGPAQAAGALALFGLDAPAAPDGAAPYEELLPPLPQRLPLAGPLDGPVAVAQELAAVLAGDESVAAFERTLDGLVRESSRDVEALRVALKPVLGERVWADELSVWSPWHTWIGLAAAAAAGQVPPSLAHAMLQDPGQGPLQVDRQERFRAVLAARIQEAAALIVFGRTPFLVATPGYADGGLEASALVERLAALEAVGGRVGADDFGQALLRVLPTDDPAVLAAAGQLRSAEGRRLAQWLAGGGLPGQRTDRVPPRFRSRPMVTQHGPAPEHESLLPPVLRRLLGPLVDGQGFPLYAIGDIATRFALATLPGHREELAARLGNAIIDSAQSDAKRDAILLPQLVEAGGPAGLAVHLTVACTLGAASAQDRTAAVDALLLLAAQGVLDTDRMGADLADAVRCGLAPLNRLPLALRQAAESGAYGTVWSVLRAALPGLLAPEPIRGVPELVAIATDCAARSGATGALPVVEALATRRGSSRLFKEARALHTVLTAG
ncbi:hypothetical protein DN069_00830 [Streptacidiphilus pinicola]|uniref:DUF7825 domain-containing protein n=1 Tax=Streptacidiphilus pinicola TaxID=2219663 RepID=A0A2X0JIL9_9ACTN|nr:DUF6493 family protein [Streptacidiphilus pinicola]RAG87568.1 hypothetical protein DN069_00830 [Streptacidiphilus pinicola]